MRPSAKRHPVASLRIYHGITAEELAEIVQCSKDTIASIETLRLPLSQKMAVKIGRCFGVAPEWLLNGDPNAPMPVEAFEQWKKPLTTGEKEALRCWAANAVSEAVSSVRTNEDASLFRFKILRAIRSSTPPTDPEPKP